MYLPLLGFFVDSLISSSSHLLQGMDILLGLCVAKECLLVFHKFVRLFLFDYLVKKGIN